MTKELQKGDTVTVFENPITCEKPEGDAIITKILRREDWTDMQGRPIVRCNVRFTKKSIARDNCVYERDVSQLTGATPQAELLRQMDNLAKFTGVKGDCIKRAALEIRRLQTEHDDLVRRATDVLEGLDGGGVTWGNAMLARIEKLRAALAKAGAA